MGNLPESVVKEKKKRGPKGANKTSIKPGEVRNPTGYNGYNGPAKLEKDVLMEILHEPVTLDNGVVVTKLRAIYENLIWHAWHGDVRAAALVVERFAGKPKQIIEATGADGAPLQAVIILPPSGLDK